MTAQRFIIKGLFEISLEIIGSYFKKELPEIRKILIRRF